MLEERIASEILAQVLLTDSQDIAWAKEVHIPDNLGELCPISKDEVQSVLMMGNDDCPDELWVSNVAVPLITTEFWRVR